LRRRNSSTCMYKMRNRCQGKMAVTVANYCMWQHNRRVGCATKYVPFLVSCSIIHHVTPGHSVALNGVWGKFRIHKYLPYTFHLQNGPKQGYATSPLLLKYALKYAISLHFVSVQ
jgi:hypothetical protein